MALIMFFKDIFRRIRWRFGYYYYTDEAIANAKEVFRLVEEENKPHDGTNTPVQKDRGREQR